MVRPSSRGGVPVFRRPSAKPAARACVDRPIAGASPTRPAGICFSPIWMSPRRKVPVVSTTAPAVISRPSAEPEPAHAAVRDNEIVGLGLDHFEVRSGPDRGLHRRGIEFAVRLRARAAHGRTFAAVEHAELDAAAVGDPAHQPVERIDLAHQMALAETADGRIAATSRRRWRIVGDQRGLAPMRAAAAAASQPAWPPPITMTSNIPHG